MAFMDYMPQFGGNTAPMQETALPADDTAMQLELKRRLKMAEALQQQAGPEGQMVSGHYVAPSWTQYLANAYGKYQGGKQEREALNQFGEYQKGKQAKLANLLTDLGQGKEVIEPMDYNEAGNMPGMEQTTRKPFSQQEFMTKVGGVMPDLVPKMLEAQLAQYGKEETPISLGEGGVLVNRKGEVIASNPKTQKAEKLFGAVNPSDFTPESLNAYAQSGNYSDLKLNPKAPTGQSNIAKLTAEMNSLPPNDPNRAVYQAAIRKETYIAPREDNQPLVAVLNAQGQPTYVPRNQAVGQAPYNPNQAKMTEMQSNANLFGTRAAESNRILQRLEGKYSPLGIQFQESMVGGLPGVSYVANKAMSPETQQAAQAQRDFVTAILRKESGAAISASEFDNARKQYFDQPGDSNQVKAQKAQNRQTAIQGIQAAAGQQNQPQVRVVDF
jgi:hypothetical protein